MLLRAAALALLLCGTASADDDGFHPFSNFGKDIPGYKNPSTRKDGSTPSGQPNMTPHPLQPSLGPYAGGSAPAEDEKEEVLTDADRKPVDPDGKPVDVEREDAQSNFHTVVEAFVAKNAVDGCWPVHAGARTLCLTYLSADNERLRKVTAGVYSGLVVLRDAKKGANAPVRFTVDFTGEEWSVLLVQLLGRKDALFHRSDVKPEDVHKRTPDGTVTVTVTAPDAKP